MGAVTMNLQNDVRVTVRVDKELKDSADFLFERLGLNMSVAFNMFLRKAVNEDAIPFPVSANSDRFGYGLTAGYISSAFNTAVQNDVKANQQKGNPIARYDADKRKAYLELPDGTKEYVNG
jgi:DNA-damage-inducible protein J